MLCVSVTKRKTSKCFARLLCNIWTDNILVWRRGREKKVIISISFKRVTMILYVKCVTGMRQPERRGQTFNLFMYNYMASVCTQVDKFNWWSIYCVRIRTKSRPSVRVIHEGTFIKDWLLLVNKGSRTLFIWVAWKINWLTFSFWQQNLVRVHWSVPDALCMEKNISTS